MRHLSILLALVLAASLTPAGAAISAPTPVLDPDVVPDPVQSATGCDPLDPSLCLFPFPNDAFTTYDEATDTTRRINFLPTAMPRNGTDLTTGDLGGEGKPTDPTEWNRNDGFSPGQAVLTIVPGLDLHATWGTQDEAFSTAGLNEPGYFDHRDHIADIGRFADDDAPIIVLNADTGERHPFWSELDTHDGGLVDDQSGGIDESRRSLILRPATNWEEGARYIVALRDLRRADGSAIEAGAAFDAVRDGSDATPRAAHLRSRVLAPLADHGVDADDLFLAWDFTVASERNLSERMLAIRDHAFGEVLGDHDLADLEVQGASPDFVVDGVTVREDSWTDAQGVARTQQYRRIEGRVFVPNYLDRVQQLETQVGPQRLPFDVPVPGSRLYDDPLDTDLLPDRNPTQPTVRAPFTCDVPIGEGPSFAMTYGHGLLGTRGQVGDVKTPRREGFAGCALDFWGMASSDLPTVAAILTDLSAFPSLPDRAQQGFLNFLFATRAMVHPDGFVTDPAFQDADGGPLLVVDHAGDGIPTQAYYDGNSQGGIMGGAIMAVSPDATRGILGVPGMNYSTLLNRSVDWEGAYGDVYYASYQDPAERQLGMQLIQMLWDRGEGNGYAHHMTDDTYPNTPPHDIMLQVAFSDHQVANISAEVEARTIGAAIMEGLGEGRHWDKEHLQPWASYPHTGSALVYWDSGNATPPNGNVPPTHAGDPHGHPRSEAAASWQEAHFLLTGEHLDVCGGGQYVTDNNPLNGGTPSCRAFAAQPGS